MQKCSQYAIRSTGRISKLYLTNKNLKLLLNSPLIQCITFRLQQQLTYALNLS